MQTKRSKSVVIPLETGFVKFEYQTSPNSVQGREGQPSGFSLNTGGNGNNNMTVDTNSV